MRCCKALPARRQTACRCTATARSGRIARAPAAAADPPSAVLLWLGDSGLRVLRRILAPGWLGRDAVDLRRTDDPRFRLVAHRIVWRGVGRRRAGGFVVAGARAMA